MPALTTPFDARGRVDEDAFARLVEMVVGDGVDGVIVNGCTGESWALSAEERATLFRIACRTVAGRVPVVAGCSGLSAADATAKMRQAEEAGCSFAMVSPPWYVIPGPDEVDDHYRRVLDAGGDLPVLLYNIPRRTGVSLSVAQVDRLADHPRVAGIKESSKDWTLLSAIIRRTRDRISVFAGYASLFGLAALCEGAAGYMDSGTPVFGARSVELYRAYQRGDLDTARRIQSEMERLLDCFFGLGTFPAAVKAALDLVGRPGGPTREPIRPLTDAQRETLRAALAGAGFLPATRTEPAAAAR